MENKSMPAVPYIVHESAQARAERQAKRLVIALRGGSSCTLIYPDACV